MFIHRLFELRVIGKFNEEGEETDVSDCAAIAPVQRESISPRIEVVMRSATNAIAYNFGQSGRFNYGNVMMCWSVERLLQVDEWIQLDDRLAAVELASCLNKLPLLITLVYTRFTEFQSDSSEFRGTNRFVARFSILRAMHPKRLSCVTLRLQYNRCFVALFQLENRKSFVPIAQDITGRSD